MDVLPAEFFRRADRVAGLTHAFYRYPATTSPQIVGDLIEHFSEPHDWILDPFMGGGTSIVEAVSRGRLVLGSDINPLATLVSRAKSTYLGRAGWAELADWAETLDIDDAGDATYRAARDPRRRNLPTELERTFSRTLPALRTLRRPEQRVLARCALLSLGRWALEARGSLPKHEGMTGQLRQIVRRMETGAQHLYKTAAERGVAPSTIGKRRIILSTAAANLPEQERVRDAFGKVRLVVTSPPYPGVHVLYHRWQVGGRKETAAAYWLARRRDGHGPSHYTMGGRHQAGIERYFHQIRDTFTAIRPLLAVDGMVLQIVAFGDRETQLPRFLEAMAEAGYRPADVPWRADDAVRVVPNRKWYARDLRSDSSIELLIAHRPVGQ